MGRAACLSDGSRVGALMSEEETTPCPVCKGMPRRRRGNPCELCGSRPATSRARYQGSRMGTLAFDEWSEVTKERDGEEADALAEYRESERRGY